MESQTSKQLVECKQDNVLFDDGVHEMACAWSADLSVKFPLSALECIHIELHLDGVSVHRFR